MDLKEFVSDVLVQVAEGIIAAQNRVKEKGVVVNPSVEYGADHGLLMSLFDKSRVPQVVEFDVCVTAENSSSIDGNGEVRVVAIGGMKGNAQKSQAKTHVSRIKFSVPLACPTGLDEDH